MSAPYYSDDSVALHHGDSLDVLREMPDKSVNCCVTSPPYFGLRAYLADDHADKAKEIGTEESPAEFVEGLRVLFAEVRRVLTDDGTLWLNLGDSYYSGRGAATGEDRKNPARRGFGRVLDKGGCDWARPKNLLGIPWRTAFALQDDGWNLRNDIIWSKPNAMPESVTDRLSCKHEHLFLFSKSRHYWFDLDPIREELVYPETVGHAFGGNHPDEGRRRGGIYRVDETNYAPGMAPQTARAATGERHKRDYGNGGKNPGDVWTIPTQPFSEAHFATFPRALAERCVTAGCKPSGTVLDPFSGSGTTGSAAARHGRKYGGIDLNSEYLDLSLRTRLAQSALIDEDAS